MAMPLFSNFGQVNKKLNSYISTSRVTSTEYTLKTMKELMRFLDNPQDKFKVIHVAGTSGKTSTCYYVAAMLTASAKRVGLTISPHMDEVNDRVQINMKPLDEVSYCQAFGEFVELVEASQVAPSYFEAQVAFAYWYFARVKVDYAVVEVGLGGLMDGTNVVDRRDKVCVITDIGLDHTNILGSDVGSIAAQKAGIIGDHNVIFTHHQVDDVMVAISDRCKTEHAQLFLVEEDDYLAASKDLPLFQQRNWTLAKEVVTYVASRDSFEVSQNNLTQSAKTYIPGRMEIINQDGKILIMDGAHNPQKLEGLMASIRLKYPKYEVCALMAMAGHKEQFEESMTIVANLAKHIIFTAFEVKQDAKRTAVDPEFLAKLAKKINFDATEVINDYKNAYQALWKRPEKILLVTGSLYLVSALKQNLK